MTSILRTIKKLIIDSTVMIHFTTWKLGDTEIERDSNVLFNDGLISLNSSSKAIIHQLQAEKYAFLSGDGTELINTYSLVDGDILLGRLDNYLLFRGGNLDIKCGELNIEAETLNITATDINITGNVTLNGVAFSVVAGKLLINGKELAVVGGDVNLTSGKITVSGQ